MKKHILLILIATLFFSCNTMQSQIKNKEKPNVIIVFIDDEGYGDVGVYGATGFQTPHIDKMASEGMRFTNFYAAQPVCSASRAGIMTGCYPNRVGINGALFPFHNTGLNSEEYTIAEMFKDQGYATACVGKWHLGWQKEFLPLQHGFDEFIGLPYSNDIWPYSSQTGERLPKDKGRGKLPDLPLIEGNKTVSYITSFEDQDNLTTMYTEKSVEFINKNADKPFFLYLPHSMGHIPLGVSDKFRGKSEQGMYGDVMMEIDWSVGEITKALKKNNIENNTIVIFTSDNGPWLSFGNHAGSAGGLKEGKLSSWEGGQRVPFIIRYPNKIPAGTVCNKLGCAIDLLPTLAAMSEGKLSDNKIDGVDISSLFKGDFTSEPRETILYYYGKNNLNGVRKGNWKLILPHTYKSYQNDIGNDRKNGKRKDVVITEPQLFDMTRDPGEQYNVITTYPEKTKELMKVVEYARKELGDLNVGIAKGTGNRAVGTL